MTKPTVERTPVWERQESFGEFEAVQGDLTGHRLATWWCGEQFAFVPVAVEEAIRADERSKWESAVRELLAVEHEREWLIDALAKYAKAITPKDT